MDKAKKIAAVSVVTLIIILGIYYLHRVGYGHHAQPPPNKIEQKNSSTLFTVYHKNITSTTPYSFGFKIPGNVTKVEFKAFDSGNKTVHATITTANNLVYKLPFERGDSQASIYPLGKNNRVSAGNWKTKLYSSGTMNITMNVLLKYS